MKDFKFVLIILLIFFGVGIMEEINAYNYNDNNTGIMYQENENIVLNENNRYYDYDIDFNLNESYLHYSPVKKSGFLDSLYNVNNKNLAMPDLIGKYYYGNGVYNLKSINGLNLNYDINTGYWYLYGTPTILFDLFLLENFNLDFETTIVFNIIQGTDFHLDVRDLFYNGDYVFSDFPKTFSSFNDIRLFVSSLDYIDYIFTIQIEKGDTATPYQVPYIPPLQIAFNGSNQVEYINPFEEQIIKINDINNVNNIDFELLNTKNPVVFNWNITTNPNIPFVKFYNDETKLLYDFTDIDEINRIGNNLIASQSNIFPVINNVLDIVDMFYTGFQKLFNNDRINTIIDFVKDTWPLLPPNLPLIPIIKGVFS